MIKSITVTNHTGDTLTMELSNPYASGFLIKEIQGLGPMKANINTVDLATMDGSLYNSARATSRNIVFSLMFLMESKTIEEIRLDSYKYFPVKRPITILVETTNRLAEIVGYVESNEPTIFTKDEGCQISVLCPDPYFHAFRLNRTMFSGVDPKFYFPFSNESLDEKLINFGEIRQNTDAMIFNDGDEDVGITMKIHIKGIVTNLVIWNVTMKETMGIDDDKLEKLTGSKLKAGDDIIIETTRGKKSAIIKRKGRKTNILNCLKKPIAWLQLQRGENVFAYTAEVGLLQVEFTIENRVVYEGV